MNARQEDEAVFWCGLLTSVLFEKLEKGEERRRLRELSQQEVIFPNGRKRKPSLSTLKRKLKKYRARRVQRHGAQGAKRPGQHRVRCPRR